MKFRIRNGNDRFVIETDKTEPTFGDVRAAIARQIGHSSAFALSLNGRDAVSFSDDSETVASHGLRNGDLLHIIELTNSSNSSASSASSMAVSTDKQVTKGNSNGHETEAVAEQIVSDEVLATAVLDFMQISPQSYPLLNRIGVRLASANEKVDIIRLVSELTIIAMSDFRCRFVLRNQSVVSKSTIRMQFETEPNSMDGKELSSHVASAQTYDSREASGCSVELMVTKMCGDSAVCFARSVSTAQPVAISSTIALTTLASALRELETVARRRFRDSASSSKRNKLECGELKQSESDAVSRFNARLSQAAVMLNSQLFSKLFDALSELIGGPRRLLQLDDYTLQSVCEYLDCASLLRFSETCRRLRQVASDNQVWYRLYLRDFCSQPSRPRYAQSLDWLTEYRTAYLERQRRRAQAAEFAARPGPVPFPNFRDPFSPFAPFVPAPLPISPFLDPDPFSPTFPGRPFSAGRSALTPLGSIRPRRFDGGPFF